MRTSSLAFSELVPWTHWLVQVNQTRGEKQGCSRADDIAASSVGRSPPKPDPPAPKKSPILRASRRVHQHGLQAEFVLLGGEEEEGGGEGIGQARGLGGKGRSSESRRRNIVREGARVASGEPARAIEGANRPFVARGFSSVGYAKSGWGALTVSWLRSLVHHLWVFVGCSQFFLLRA